MPECLDTLGTWIGFISSVVTIVCLPITVLQVVSVKKKLKSTEDALIAYNEQTLAATFDDIIESVKQISAQILQLQAASKKEGFDCKSQMAQQSCGEILMALNKCLDQLPPAHKEIEHQIRAVMKDINLFVDYPARAESAYFNIKEIMTLLKNEQVKHNQINLEMIAKASQ